MKGSVGNHKPPYLTRRREEVQTHNDLGYPGEVKHESGPCRQHS